jgi:hypothetical protein
MTYGCLANPASVNNSVLTGISKMIKVFYFGFVVGVVVSKLLVASHSMAGHVNPMLAVSESLSKGVHDIIFNTSKLSREEVEARGLRFAPLLGNASFDHR